MQRRLPQRWWWVFCFLIAGPALVLALLGVRALRADRIEREQQLREQQTQAARLADGALGNAIDRIAAQLDRVDVNSVRNRTAVNDPHFPVFVVDERAILGIPSSRIYFGELGARPSFLPAAELPSELSSLVTKAQAMEAQRRKPEAIELYRQIARHDGLADWAALALARLDQSIDAALKARDIADPFWGRSQGITPGGVPIAIVASSAVEEVSGTDAARFAPLLEETLKSLRADFWWLSYEQRCFYDAELRRWLKAAGASDVGNDPHLEEAARVEHVVRRESRGNDLPRLEIHDGPASLIVWSRISRSSGAVGAVIAGSALDKFLNDALRPLFNGQSFTAVLLLEGSPLWNRLPQGAAAWRNEPLTAIRGLQLDFTGPAQALDGNHWIRYGSVLLPLLLLIAGLVMTVRVVRQEVALNQMQAKFLAAVSHELKSPITGIRLLMERIVGGRFQSPGDASEYYAAIGRETDRLENLVNRLLESQKIQADGRKYTFEQSSITEVVDNAIQRLRPQADAKGIRLEAQIDDGTPTLRFDHAVIGDAIENLLDNAIKYSRAGTLVSVHTRSSKGEVLIEVCDQGIGIDKSDLPRIFDPFYRGGRGDLENVKGTGLGLALVKAAADAHHGRVEVSSVPFAGSRFTLRLPMGEEP